jgi:hypothetical protein
MESQQQAESDARAAKMAELHTLFAKEQEAMNRARYAAVMGKVKEEQEELHKVAELRQKRDQVENQRISANASATSAGASVTSAAAAAQNAKTLEEQRQFEQRMYPEKFALEKRKAEADIARAGRPDEFQQRLKLYQTNPEAYNAMYGAGSKGALTQDQMFDNWQKMGFQEKLARKERAGGDILKAEQDYYREVKGSASAANKPTGGVTVKAPNGQTYSFPTAQAAEEFKKKAGIQ